MVQRGAGTLLSLGIVGVALAVLMLISVAGHVGSKQLEVQALADRIALVSDDALRGKTPTPPCQLAEEISAKNSAELDTCRIVERKVFIELHIYIDFSFLKKTATLSLKASAAAEPLR